MADNDGAVKQFGRILYVEPNDIYGTINGIPIAPDYENYCIGFNLIVQKVNRYNPRIVTACSDDVDNNDNNDSSFVISWISNGGTGESGDNWVSFMKGSDYGDTSFLTTYYTDITFDNVKKKNIVEGLGVESVTVSFESFYVPTVVIKFVDVRGSSLFGREEAIHKNGEITADNVFGCFMMFPYPKFKLQIKGFYGKPVTYQLTVLNFNGTFNASNGNFEVTVKFIGYKYSLLTDIPLLYLVAAPYCNFEGRKYWADKKTTSEWQMDNGSEPPTLYELINKIDAAMAEDSDVNKISDDDSEELRRCENENTALNKIQSCLNKLVGELQKNSAASILTDNYLADDEDYKKHKQLLCMYAVIDDTEENTRKFTENELKAHKELVEAVNSYNSMFPKSQINRTKCFQNRQTVLPSTYNVKDLINIEESDGEITEVTLNGYSDKEISTVRNIFFNICKPTYTMAAELCKRISGSPFSKNIARYCILFEWKDMETVITKRQTEISARKEEIIKKVSVDRSKNILKVLDFEPYIGNIFKILMCHLETFCHIISSSVIKINDQIKNGKRKPSALGISIDDTDAANTDDIPAWPAMYNEGKKTSNGGYRSQIKNIEAWPGDFSGDFVEQEVVQELRNAVMMVKASEENSNSPTSVITSFPVLPCDLNSSNSPFYNTSDNDISSLAGYVGIRIAQIFGVMFKEDVSDVSLVREIARMDAYNYYISIGNLSTLNNNIINVTANESLSDVLINIMLCNSSGDTYADYYQESQKYSHSFENHSRLKSDYNSNRRCPIFKSDSGDYFFIRFYDKNDISLIPSRLDEWDNYKDYVFSYTCHDDEVYFSPIFDDGATTYDAESFLHICNASQIVDDSEKLEKYINKDLFNIISSDDSVSDIKNVYDRLSSGQVTLTDYSAEDDLQTFLEKVWLVDDENYSEFYNNSLYVLTQSADELGIDTDNLLGDDKTTVPSVMNYGEWLNYGRKRIVKYTSEGELKVFVSDTADDGTSTDNEQTVCLNELVVQQSNVMQGQSMYSLFGHAIYYMQNKKLSGESDDECNDRRAKSKCLLFLHTLNYNLGKIPNFLKDDKDCGTVEKVPYGYLLLLGGLLWRRRYYMNHDNVDPIVTKSGNIQFKSSISHALSVKYTDNSYRLTVFNTGETSSYNVKMTDIFGGKSISSLDIDYHVENSLINIFENFAEIDFGPVMSNCEIYNVSGTNVSLFDAQTFTSFVKNYISILNSSSKTISDALKYISENTSGIFGHYCAIYANKDNNTAVRLLLREDNNAQEIIRTLYYQESIVLDTGGKKLSESDDEADVQVSVSSSCVSTYVNEFANTLSDIASGINNANNETDDNNDKENTERDLSIPIYYYIKNLYDRWLISSYSNEFDVDVFFKNNFIFIDKFYQSIYDKVTINLDVLSELYHSKISGDTPSFYSFISDIVGRHYCLLIELPDFVYIGDTKQDRKNAMEKLFKPLSFNEGMEKPRLHNNFIVVYVGKTSESSTDNDGYVSDGFNIRDDDETVINMFQIYGENEAKDEEEYDVYTLNGYDVPAFGVSFGRQNQQVFKNINVSLDNPMNTELSINTTYGIAMEGSKKAGSLIFYGQDVYNIYGSYSYSCVIEMMGNAQIQPLMYFQLMNIPVWNGAYMIFKVEHTMTPGNMTTKITGQKMSKYNIPYPSNYYTKAKEKASIDTVGKTDSSTEKTESSETDYEMPNSYTSAGSYVSCDMDNLKENYLSESEKTQPVLEIDGVSLNSDLCKLLNQLVYEVENYSDGKWTLLISSAVRDYSSIGKSGDKKYETNTSEHYYKREDIPANAVDLQIASIDNSGNKKKIKDAEKMFIVMDILVTNHLDEIGQLIFEGESGYSFLKGDSSYLRHYTCLHLSYKGNISSAQVFLSDAASGKNMAYNYDLSVRDKYVPSGYKAVAKKVYESSTSDNKFKNIFLFYYDFSSEELEEHFGTERGSSLVPSSINC